jgi:hypothetical protein
MTFLRSPVLAIFAIVMILPDADISARALDEVSAQPSRLGGMSSGTSRLDRCGAAAVKIEGEELRLWLTYDSTRCQRFNAGSGYRQWGSGLTAPDRQPDVYSR